MKNFLKTLIALTLVSAFLLTGCEMPDVSSEASSIVSDGSSCTPENLLSDEEAKSILKSLLTKRSNFASYITEMAEFGPHNIDGSETFEEDGLVYAQYVFSNFKNYQEETHGKSWDENTFGFSSIEEINKHITSIFLTEEDANYSNMIHRIFKERNGMLFYNIAEESPAPRPAPDFETVKIVEKNESKIIFSGECRPYVTTPTNFSMVKNSKGEWRLTNDVYLR